MKRTLFLLGVYFLIFINVDAQKKWIRGPQLNFTGEFTQTFDSVKFINNGGYDDNGFGQSSDPASLIIYDFNKDGKKDIIFRSYYNRNDHSSDDVFFLRFYKNNGDNTFTEVTKSISPNVFKIFRGNGGYSRFDFNKDGIDDLFFGSGGFEGNAQATPLANNYLSNPTLNMINGVDFITGGTEVAPGYLPRQQFIYSDSGKLKEGQITKFDKKYFSSIIGQVVHDINKDGFEDIIVLGDVFSYNDTSKVTTRLSSGFGVFLNMGGKYFTFTNGIDTHEGDSARNLNTIYKPAEVRVDIGPPNMINYNGDGNFDLQLYARVRTIEYLTKSDSINNNAKQYSLNFESRVYLNNNGRFDANNYVVLNNVSSVNLKKVDINGDGKLDLIGMDDPEHPDSLVWSSGINIFLNIDNKNYKNATKDYFSNDSLILNNKLTPDHITSASDFTLSDIDGDSLIDIIPIDANSAPYQLNGSIYGNGAPNMRNGWNPHNKNTFYYKNINNASFKRIDIGLFPNYKLIDSTDYFNYKNTEYYNAIISNNSSVIPAGDSLITNFLYMMNDIIPVDFNGDGIYELFAFNKSGAPSYTLDGAGKLTGPPNLPKLTYQHPANAGFVIYQCNLAKPTFNTTKYSFCSGDSLKLTITNINKGDSLKWYYGTKSDLKNVTNKTFTDSTRLFVTRTDSLGCIISSDTLSLVKYTIPSTPTLSRDTANYLVSNSSIGNKWYKDATALTDTTQKFKPTTPGSYTVKTTQNGCISAASEPYHYLVTDVINLSADEFIKLAPNPFINQLNFDFVVKGYQRLNLEIFDIATGTKVASKQNQSPGLPIYLGQLSAGTYVIKVSSNDNKISYQFKMVKL